VWKALEGASARVCVLGLGRSGLAAAQLLLRRGVGVRALEQNVTPRIREAWMPLGEAGGELIAGAHRPEVLEGCQLLVRSPGVPANVPILEEARRRGIAIRSELALASSMVHSPILAITGTNGKSTTTAWTAHLLRRSGIDAQAVGNIGRPFSSAVLECAAETIFVVEVSSFQLEDSPEFHPRAATILNITPDHLDRHGSLAAYAAAKWAIAASQEPGDLLVLGPQVALRPEQTVHARTIRCSTDELPAGDGYFRRGGVMWRRIADREEPLLPAGELALPGPHNLINAMAATALAAVLVPEPERLVRGLRDFPGLPHRLEEVGQVGGVRLINDSKSTNVASLRVALQSFEPPLVLIAGGRDKEGPFGDLADLARERVRHLVAIGEAARKIRSAWPRVPSETAAGLDEAVTLGLQAAGGQGVVLLSPGCASFDMFRDFEERGDVFRALVAQRVAAAISPVETGEG
jgi:UDP-N-acetylmuramoylalanine--D-glutamate ligase